MTHSGITSISGHATGECIANLPLTVGLAVPDFEHALCAAEMYGNQDEIGNALEKLIKEGIVKREDIWITSKACTPCQHSIQAASRRFKPTLVSRDWLFRHAMALCC